jgi:hypothetical protein
LKIISYEIDIKVIDFEELRSTKVPSNYWDSLDKRRQFVKYLEERLNIKEIEDWKSVTVQDVKYNGGREWLKKYVNNSTKIFRDHGKIQNIGLSSTSSYCIQLHNFG